MALTPQQQTQYNQLKSAGASESAAMNAAMLVSGGTPVATPPNAPAVAQVSNAGVSTAPVTPPNAPQTGATPTDTQSSTPSNPAAPTANLQQGAKGQDVSALQSYLVQMGYLTPEQVNTGQGVYGPQTTAAVAKMQQDLGVQAGTAAGAYGPQTQAAIKAKYQGAFQSLQNTTAPDTAGAANLAIQSGTQPSTDPVFGALSSSLAPIMQSLNQVLSNINNPALTATSLQSEYNTLSSQYNLPSMQADMLNMQNVMNGTTDDIRSEITKAGGTASESQIMGMSTARNNVILKQYNALSTQYQAAQNNVQTQMQYATTDQATQLQREQATAGVTESMASIESQALSMGMSMQQNAVANYQKTLTGLGGNYTAFASTIPTNMQPAVESMMGMAPGTLSDPQELQILTDASYKQMQMQIAAQRANVYAYNAGYPTTSPTQPTYPGGTPANNVSPFSQNNPVNNTASQTSYTVQSGDGLRSIASKYGITSDAGIQAIATMNGIKNINQIQAGQTLQIPIAVKDNASGQTGYISADAYDPSKYTSLGSTPVIASQTAIDKAYQSMTTNVKTAQATPITGSPLNKGRLTRNANSALKNYLASPVYTAVSSGATYLARINAAMADPGSISDTSLADSIIKIETGGGQVTEAQLNTYFAGQSFADQFAVTGDKITAKGGVLSPQQRTDLAGLAKGVFANYQQQYENLYVQAMQNLQGQGIPLNYGGNLPDFLSLIQTAPATQ